MFSITEDASSPQFSMLVIHKQRELIVLVGFHRRETDNNDKFLFFHEDNCSFDSILQYSEHILELYLYSRQKVSCLYFQYHQLLHECQLATLIQRYTLIAIFTKLAYCTKTATRKSFGGLFSDVSKLFLTYALKVMIFPSNYSMRIISKK